MKATITTKDFISFVKLFPQQEEIVGLQIGTTQYKKEGWIDQKILNGDHTLQAILNLDFKFGWLYPFVGKIGLYKIDLMPIKEDETLVFEIESNEVALRSLEYKVIEQNAVKLGLFQFDYIKVY